VNDLNPPDESGAQYAEDYSPKCADCDEPVAKGEKFCARCIFEIDAVHNKGLCSKCFKDPASELEGLCPSCESDRSEAAYERSLDRFYGGSGPQSIQEQYEQAAEEKRKLR
jgi:hypothetical protein